MRKFLSSARAAMSMVIWSSNAQKPRADWMRKGYQNIRERRRGLVKLSATQKKAQKIWKETDNIQAQNRFQALAT